jgi:hypothetical protein
MDEPLAGEAVKCCKPVRLKDAWGLGAAVRLRRVRVRGRAAALRAAGGAEAAAATLELRHEDPL